MTRSLTDAQRTAVRHVAARASGPPVPAALRVTINFHPDRLAGGALTMQQMVADGRYRSQFETRTSAGGLTAHRGGDRWQWESRMFDGAYDDADGSQRPLYGALNHRGRPVGGSHRFGSCHLRLRASVLERTTMCYPDSVLEPTHMGVAGACDLITLANAADDAAGAPDILDDYIEAQVHGGVMLAHDVAAVVLDPSFRGTAVEQVAARSGCTIEWHAGFGLQLDGADEAWLEALCTYRGRPFLDLARTIAVDGTLTPRLLGEAARTGLHDWQDLKRVWHILARFGWDR